MNTGMYLLKKETKMPKCIMLVGVPASGKSTWRVRCKVEDFTIELSTDDIIERLADRWGFTYNEIFKDTISFAEKVMKRDLIEAAERDVDVIIDRTNLTAKSRRKFIEKLKPHGYEFEAVVFPMPGTEKLSTEEWNRRLDSRPGKTIPGHILSSMIEHYEPPTLSEGFSKVTIL
jgi:predicted kinase